MTTTVKSPAPATTTWQIDTAHTEVEFSVRHLMISNVKGRFGQVTGSVHYDPAAPQDFALEVSIPIASIDTREAKRDAHLRSADFFDAEHHPAMTFRGRRVEGAVSDAFRLSGDLTIRGTTRDVVLDVALEGQGDDPWGNERMGFSATTTIDRRDFGLTWNAALETGGVMVGEQVKISINTELMRPKNG
jgi:polyisoprenoid-binding protein YceI